MRIGLYVTKANAVRDGLDGKWGWRLATVPVGRISGYADMLEYLDTSNGPSEADYCIPQCPSVGGIELPRYSGGHVDTDTVADYIDRLHSTYQDALDTLRKKVSEDPKECMGGVKVDYPYCNMPAAVRAPLD